MTETHTTKLRFGHVTEYDPSRHMARVNFPDMGIVSYWLPVLVNNSLKNHDYAPLDIGEHVACMMAGEMGVVLGAFYDDKNPPPAADRDIRRVLFEDGTQVSYDRQSSALIVDAKNDVLVNAVNVEVSADEIEIYGKEKLTLKGKKILASFKDWDEEEL